MPGDCKLLFTVYKFIIENKYIISEMRADGQNGQQKDTDKLVGYKKRY